MLTNATRIARIVPDIAAREAYLAAFHGAEALIAVRTGKVARTHRGVNATFTLLARDEPTLGPDSAAFLAGSYEVKQHVDYLVGPAERSYSSEEAEELIAKASKLVDTVAAIVGS